MMLQQATMFGVRDERIKVKRGFAATGSGRGRHENSLAGHDAMSVELRGRRAQVMGWLLENGPATDRQVRDGLYGPSADMNMVRPRISELLDARVIRELDRVEDASTGMQVRRVAVMGKAES